MPMSIDELIESAIGYARTELIGKLGAELMPAWLIQGEDRVTIIGTPFDGDLSKDFAAAAIRALLEKEKAVSYSFMSEAWMATQNVGEPFIPASKSDKRREIVMVTAFERNGQGKQVNYEIKRGGDGVVTELALMPNPGAIDFSGRFHNLFSEMIDPI